MTAKQTGLIEGPDGALRCAWHGNDDFYRDYHDHEWGRPVSDDYRLFEKICLEGFQSGLSWITILRKRENFREAFDGFRFERIAFFSDRDVERLLGDAGIVRHRGKIESVINNAKRAKALIDEAGSLARFFWRFEPGPKERPRRIDYQTLLANTTSPASINLSSELKKRGWTFVGPTTVYAFMQAMGLVNDHIEGCVCRTICELERKQFRRP
jgi:DNA-3-methyladenine glycosylase I